MKEFPPFWGITPIVVREILSVRSRIGGQIREELFRETTVFIIRTRLAGGRSSIVAPSCCGCTAGSSDRPIADWALGAISHTRGVRRGSSNPFTRGSVDADRRKHCCAR